MANEKPQERIIRLPEILERTGLSAPTIWRREKAGKFPKRVKLGPNASGWLGSEVDAWFNDLAKNRAVA